MVLGIIPLSKHNVLKVFHQNTDIYDSTQSQHSRIIPTQSWETNNHPSSNIAAGIPKKQTENAMAETKYIAYKP